MATTHKLLVILALLAILWASASAQNCGCASGLCCSQYGYCGTSSTYCGVGCRSGPCQGTSTPAQGGKPGDIITRSFFNGLLSEGGSCSGKGKTFYNYDAFVNAANSFPRFGTTGGADVRKREMAAFFANVMHETGSLCFINEQNPTMIYCDPSKGPCAAGKDYHGRGPLQLSWNYNYGAAGKDIHFDGINNPDKVAQDATVSFKAAVWFWMKQSTCHTAITSGQGFGGTITAINSKECGGGKTSEVSSRVRFYRRFCSQLGVDVGPNVSC